MTTLTFIITNSAALQNFLTLAAQSCNFTSNHQMADTQLAGEHSGTRARVTQRMGVKDILYE